MTSETEFFTSSERIPMRSFAEANQELVKSFLRYLESRGMAAPTMRSYKDSVERFVEVLGAVSVLESTRTDIREFLTGLLKKGLSDNSVLLHTAALRSFWKFIGMSGLTAQNPTLLFAHRKAARRLPRVLTIEEVEELIGAARNPFERAVTETLYATGVRVAEVVNLRIENVDFSFSGGVGSMLVKRGKGGKDRYVLFGMPAAKAIQDYLDWRPSKAGFLFERRGYHGSLRLEGSTWQGVFPVSRVVRSVRIGSTLQFHTREQAREEFDRILASTPGYKQYTPGPYTPQAIRLVLNRLAWRAGIGHVHPHALRRAFACHLLSSGASIRVIQELLGHSNITTTMLYTDLTAEELKKIHQKCHPHEQNGDLDAKDE